MINRSTQQGVDQLIKSILPLKIRVRLRINQMINRLTQQGVNQLIKAEVYQKLKSIK